MSPPDPKRALLSQVVGRALVERVSPLLAEQGVPLMPLKGVWLQAMVYDVGERAITDVDLLVPEDAFDRAKRALCQAGFRERAGNISEASFEHDDFGLPIDLHRRLFQPGAFNLPTADLFARARLDQTAFGVELHMPAPLDVFAHLVGHFVKSRTALDDAMRLRDFKALASRLSLDPRECAAHLDAAAMARAARYVLATLAEGDDAFCQAVLRALPKDEGAERVLAVAAWLAQNSGAYSPLGALPGFLLERSLAAGARSALMRLWAMGLMLGSKRG